MSALPAFDSMVSQLTAMGIPREKAERQARTELRIEPPTPADEAKLVDRFEREIEQAGDKQLRALGFEVVKFSHPGKTKQTPGIPDRRYYHRARGIAFWWEAKSASGRQRPDQKHFQEMCEEVGEPYVLGTDRDLFTWLVEQRIAVWTVGDLLVALPYPAP